MAARAGRLSLVWRRAAASDSTVGSADQKGRGNGSFTATMTHGGLSNAALIGLASASLQALGIEVPAQGEVEIRCFGIIGSFNAGVGRFRTIALDTTHLQLDGAGQVDLGAETLALKLHPLARLSAFISSVEPPRVRKRPLYCAIVAGTAAR